MAAAAPSFPFYNPGVGYGGRGPLGEWTYPAGNPIVPPAGVTSQPATPYGPGTVNQVPGDSEGWLAAANPGPSLRSQFLSYLYSLPGVAAARGTYDTQSFIDRQQLEGGLSQLLSQYGDPALARQLGSLVDPQTAALAQAGTIAGTSVLGQLRNAAAAQFQSQAAGLTGTGMGGSGAVGQMMNLLTQSDALKSSAAGQTLLGSESGLENTYDTDIGKLEGGLDTSIAQGIQNVYSHPGSYPMAVGRYAQSVNPNIVARASVKAAPVITPPATPTIPASRGTGVIGDTSPVATVGSTSANAPTTAPTLTPLTAAPRVAAGSFGGLGHVG